jgi:hypothetical protein
MKDDCIKNQDSSSNECRSCHKLQDVVFFRIRALKKDGRLSRDSLCDDCRKAACRAYYKKHAPAMKEQAVRYYAENQEVALQRVRQYRETNAKEIAAARKQKYHTNRDQILKSAKQWRLINQHHVRTRSKAYYARTADKRRAERRAYVRKNPEKAREAVKRDQKERRTNGKAAITSRNSYLKRKVAALAWEKLYRRTNINRNISSRLRIRINAVIRYGKKSAPTEKLLGCTVPVLRKHLEGLFTPDMNWEEFLKGRIHIDHIIPCAAFDLSVPQNQLECFHYSNLQPLWGRDNLRKGTQR